MAYQGGAKVLPDLQWVVAAIVPGKLQRRAARGEQLPEGENHLDLDTTLVLLSHADYPLIRKHGPFYCETLDYRPLESLELYLQLPGTRV